MIKYYQIIIFPKMSGPEPNPKYLVASAYDTTFRKLGKNALKAHNKNRDSEIHYFIKKNLHIDVMKYLITIVDQKYEGSLEDDLNSRNIEGENAYDELKRQNNTELLKLLPEEDKHEFVLL